MLNPFPDLLSFALMGPFLLRVVLGLIFIDLGILKFKREKESWTRTFDALGLRPAEIFVVLYGLLQVVGGLMLIVGVWTQVAALAFAIFSGIELSLEYKNREVLKRDLVFYLLLFVISLSLLVTGAGAFAVDIPL